MKYLIIVLLAFLTLGVQAQKKDRKIDNKITADSIVTQKLRTSLIKFNDGTSMSTASTGSTIYANNGLMMNGDTVILGNSAPMYYPLIVKNELDNWQNTLQMSSSGPELLSYRLPIYELISISMFNRNQGNPYIQLLHSRDNKSFIAKFDSSGIQYEGIDTTLTTPNHLMTEAQTKREINAMQPTNNIFSWDAVNKWYAPYSSKQASMSFYTGTTNPTLTTRLNLDGNLYSTNLYTDLAQTTSVIATGTVAHPNIPNGYMEMYMYNNAGTYVGRLFSYTGSAYKDLAIGDWNNGNPNIMLKVGGNVGFGTGNPSAALHLKAGTTSIPPLKLTAGNNLTTPQAGSIEFDGTHFYGTIGSTRYQLDQQSTPDIADNILDWDGTNSWYAPYSSKQAFMSAYLGTDDPTIFTRLNIDATLHAFSFQGRQVVALSSVASSNALGLFGRTSNGPASHIYQSGNNELWAGMFTLKLERTNGGSGNLLNNILEINDSPTTSGTRSGKIMKVTVDGVERISLDPRATGTTTPYIFQTHDKPTGNLFEYGIQGRNKVYADTSGNLTHKAIGAEIYRGRLSGDTTQSIPTGTTPTKVTAFASNGQSSICTADKDNDQLILNKIGWYDAELSISYNSGTANVEWVAYIFGNNTEIPSIGSMGKAVASGDGRSTQLGGRFYVSSVPYYVDYRVTHNNGGSVNVTFSRLNLRVTYQGY